MRWPKGSTSLPCAGICSLGFLFWCLVFTQPAAAQEALSLQELVQRALQENYDIKLYRNIERITENSNTRGNAGMLPTVDITLQRQSAINNSEQQFFTGDSQSATNAKRDLSSASIEANWVVFDGLAMFARKDQLEQLEQLSRADTRFFMEQTVADLATAYYQLQQETQLLEAYRKTLEVSRERLDFEERAFEIGTNTRLDIQLARVDLNTDSSLVLNQEAMVQEMEIAINGLINRDLLSRIQPTDSITLSSNLSLADLQESARINNASLNQQLLNELIASSQIDIVKGALFPEVELYGNFDFNRQTNEVGFLESSRTFGPTYGIRVRFNLFSGYQSKIAHENAIIALETEKLRTESLHWEIEQALQVAYLRWLTRSRQVALERQSLDAAAETLEVARGQYELGALTNLDFRVIQLNAINAETRFLEAQLAAKQQEIELWRLSGSLLEEVF